MQTLTALQQVNADYERKFEGMKLIEFVNGRPLAELVPILRQRVDKYAEVPTEQDVEFEIDYALRAMVDIARHRLALSNLGNI